MRLAYQVTLTAAGDEINKIMRFPQRERRERGRRTKWKGHMKERAVRQTDKGKTEKKTDTSHFRGWRIGVENGEVRAVRDRVERES